MSTEGMPILIVYFLVHRGAFAADVAPHSRDTLPAKLDLAEIPLGLGDRPETKDNPLTEARVQLGRQLFFDPILSGDKTVACASCHQPEHGFASATGPSASADRRSRGERRRCSTARSAEHFSGMAELPRSKSKLCMPIADPAEMGSSVADAVRKLTSHDEYKKQFAAAFDDGVNGRQSRQGPRRFRARAPSRRQPRR